MSSGLAALHREEPLDAAKEGSDGADSVVALKRRERHFFAFTRAKKDAKDDQGSVHGVDVEVLVHRTENLRGGSNFQLFFGAICERGEEGRMESRHLLSDVRSTHKHADASHKPVVSTEIIWPVNPKEYLRGLATGEMSISEVFSCGDEEVSERRV